MGAKEWRLFSVLLLHREEIFQLGIKIQPIFRSVLVTLIKAVP